MGDLRAAREVAGDVFSVTFTAKTLAEAGVFVTADRLAIVEWLRWHVDDQMLDYDRDERDAIREAATRLESAIKRAGGGEP